jgi:hypothetical protein
VLLIFSSPFCESCQALMPKLPGLAAQHADALRLVVVSRGTVQQNVAKMTGPFTPPVLLQQDFEVANRLRLNADGGPGRRRWGDSIRARRWRTCHCAVDRRVHSSARHVLRGLSALIARAADLQTKYATRRTDHLGLEPLSKGSRAFWWSMRRCLTR